MNLRCKFGFHRWANIEQTITKENVIVTTFECIRCGEQIITIDVRYQKRNGEFKGTKGEIESLDY